MLVINSAQKMSQWRVLKGETLVDCGVDRCGENVWPWILVTCVSSAEEWVSAIRDSYTFLIPYRACRKIHIEEEGKNLQSSRLAQSTLVIYGVTSVAAKLLSVQLTVLGTKSCCKYGLAPAWVCVINASCQNEKTGSATHTLQPLLSPGFAEFQIPYILCFFTSLIF